jgi:hypothetical protein
MILDKDFIVGLSSKEKNFFSKEQTYKKIRKLEK